MEDLMKLWEEYMHDIPCDLNNDGKLGVEFHKFPIGTPQDEIISWFRKQKPKSILKTALYDFDHMGCPSWPNCDVGPMGCSVVRGDKVEWYGHRD